MRHSRSVLGLLLLLALISASRLGYLSLYTLAGVCGLCLLGARHVFRGLGIERRLSAAKAYIGQEVTVTVEAANHSRLPLGWISLQAANLANFEVFDPVARAGVLPGRGRFRLDYRMAGTARGCYRLGKIRIAGGDPLGVCVEETAVADPGDALTVYPRISPLRDVPLPNVRPFGAQRDRLRAHEDPSRLAGIRDYQPGDSLRRIHWRASASRGRLQVKEFIPTVTAESLILLNLGENEYPMGSWAALGELGVEAAASLAAHLTRLDTVIGFGTNGGDPEHPGAAPIFLPPGGGISQGEAVLTVLARVQVVPGPGFAALVAACSRSAPWGSSLFVITPVWTEILTGLTRSLQRTGKTVVAMLLEPKNDDMAGAAAAGLAVMTVRRDRERGGVSINRAR